MLVRLSRFLNDCMIIPLCLFDSYFRHILLKKVFEPQTCQPQSGGWQGVPIEAKSINNFINDLNRFVIIMV